jgi:hypothetical protein
MPSLTGFRVVASSQAHAASALNVTSRLCSSASSARPIGSSPTATVRSIATSSAALPLPGSRSNTVMESPSQFAT